MARPPKPRSSPRRKRRRSAPAPKRSDPDRRDGKGGKGGRAAPSSPAASRREPSRPLSSASELNVPAGAPSHEEQRAGFTASELQQEFDKARASGPEPDIVITRDVETANVLARMYPVRKATVLLLQGINELTGRPIRVYIAPSGRLTFTETLGQLERTWPTR